MSSGEPVLSDTLPASADAVVIGAGMVGAATAAALAATGQRVLVVDGAAPLGGTTAAGGATSWSRTNCRAWN